MIVTELRNKEMKAKEIFSNYTDHEIILSWLTEEVVNPYNSETDGAYEAFYINEMGQMDEQDKLDMVRSILSDCTDALSWSQEQLSPYLGEKVDTKQSTIFINQFSFEKSIINLFKDAGLKDEFLSIGQKHTYLGCIFTWLITSSKNRLCELDTVTHFGFSEYFNMDMWNLIYCNQERVYSIMQLVLANDIESLEYLIYEINKLRKDFLTFERRGKSTTT